MSSEGVILGRPSIAYGGLRPKILRATRSEATLEKAKQQSSWVLGDQKFAQGIFNMLHEECDPGEDYVLSDPAYRRHLATALFYKVLIFPSRSKGYKTFLIYSSFFQFVLDVLGSRAPSSTRSGALPLTRGISSGSQYFATDPSLYPVNEPLPKVESRPQCTGETRYVDDLPLEGAGDKSEVYAAFVVSTLAACDIDKVDPSGALV